jgi:hypothetical protein
VGRDRDAAVAVDVVDDIARFPAERIRARLRETKADDVSAMGADLDGVEAQNA